MTADIPEDQLLPFIRAHSPFGWLGLQHELDAAVVFLAGNASSCITDTTVAVDGGMSGR